MNSIYETSVWDVAKSYKQYDYVSYDGLVYYALSDIGVKGFFDSTDWGGIGTDGISTKPEFIWKPSYNSSTDFAPRSLITQFGDGYEQRIKDGLSNSLIVLNYTFELRTAREATAILHFLYSREGVESFFFTPPEPINKQLKFICREFSHSEIFYNNHSIRVKFEERVN